MDSTITRAEHEEFRRRMEEANKRQDKRLELLENTVEEINALTVSVERLANSMESMLKELTRQGERLEELESRDGEKWRSMTGTVVAVVVTAAVSFMLARFGL